MEGVKQSCELLYKIRKGADEIIHKDISYRHIMHFENILNLMYELLNIKM